MCAFVYFVILVIPAILIRVFFVTIKCLDPCAIYADFFRFLQAVFIKHVFAKLRQMFARKFLLLLPIVVEVFLLAIFAISSIYISVSLKSAVCENNLLASFATVFNPGNKWALYGRTCEKYLPFLINRIP